MLWIFAALLILAEGVEQSVLSSYSLDAAEVSRLRGRGDVDLALSLLETQAAAAAAGAPKNTTSSHVNFSQWDGATDSEDGAGADPLHQVSDFLEHQEQKHLEKTSALASGDGETNEFMSLLETASKEGTGDSSSSKAEKVHAFCEICILVMQMKERGQPHLCAGLNPDYFVSCVENLESLLRADKAVTYWLRSGCMHLDREGPEIVKPCPAHAICAWVPNLFEDVGIVTPRNELAPMCPRDFKYLPRIPRKQAVE